MSIHEFRQPIAVDTPLGKGYAFMVTDYGWTSNTVWTVALLDGQIRHFQLNQILVSSDHTWGMNAPFKTTTPNGNY